MVLDKKIKTAATSLGITLLDDWKEIAPQEILAVENCGPQTLDHIRLYLAGHGITLLGDETPAYWQRTLASAKIGAQLASDDKGKVLDFTILVDTAEQIPWRFQGFTGDSKDNGQPLLIKTKPKHLGPTHGDYSIDGLEGEVHIERKGVQDAIGTFLSHGERRERWLRTLEFLASIPCAAIVIEDSLEGCLRAIESRGSRPKNVLQKTFHRQVLAWAQDYRIPFHFCDEIRGSVRFAEATALAILRRYYDQKQGNRRKQIDDDEPKLTAEEIAERRALIESL